MKEFVVAYDAREMWMSTEQYFPPKYDQVEWYLRSLLRKDVIKRLSVDKLVWKSLFHSYISVFIQPDFVVTGTIPDRANEEVPAEYRAWDFHAWSDLSVLQTYLTHFWHRVNQPCWLVAYSMFGKAEQVNDYTIPLEVQPEWKFLGYDVAEDFGAWGKVDGLFQPEEEAPYLLDKFLPYLNQYQLFTTYEAANEYCRWADQNDPYGHSPNYVYGLYHIDTFPKPKQIVP